MKERDLGESVEQKRFFETVNVPSTVQDEGTRDMTPLLPFVVSGGQNTERYYFIHISNLTDYKFKIVPEYFGEGQFLTSGSLGSGNALWEVSDKSVHPAFQGEKMLLEESVPLTGAKKIYMMLLKKLTSVVIIIISYKT